MTNFNFLEHQFSELKDSAEKAEKLIIIDPESCMINSRKSLELLVKWIYSNNLKDISLKNTTLNDLLSNISFKQLVPLPILKKMHEIKQLGNRAAHEIGSIHVKDSSSLIHDLFEIYTWFFSQYATYDKGLINSNLKGENNFDELLKVAEQGDAQAQYLLGQYFDEGIIVDKNLHDAFYWYQKSAQQNNIKAELAVAKCFKNGTGVEESEFEAFNLYQKLANQEIAEAQYYLGLCYYEGIGTDENAEEAYYWYHKSAKQNFPLAEFTVGQCLLWGDGIIENNDDALFWLERACTHNFSEAYYLIGKCFERGWGTEINLNSALSNYLKASELGYSDAQFKTGWFYEKGIGTAVNIKRAFYFYKLAASNQNRYGRYKLATCYRSGSGTNVDHFEAFNNFLAVIDPHLNDMSEYEADWEENYDVLMIKFSNSCIANYYFEGIDGKLDKNILSALEMFEKCIKENNRTVFDRVHQILQNLVLSEHYKDIRIAKKCGSLMELLQRKRALNFLS